MQAGQDGTRHGVGGAGASPVFRSRLLAQVEELLAFLAVVVRDGAGRKAQMFGTFLAAALPGTEHLAAIGVLEEHTQFQPLPGDIGGNAAEKIRSGLTAVDTVVVRDVAVAVFIVVLDITSPHTLGIKQGGHFVVVLIDAVHPEHIPGAHGLADDEGVLVAAVQLAVFHHNDVGVFQQALQAVPGPGQIPGQIPFDGTIQNTAAQGNLSAQIVHHADVAGAGSISGGGHHGTGIQQAVGDGVEDIGPQVHPAAEEFHVCTQVILGALFPFQVLGRLADFHSGRAVVGVAAVDQRHRIPVADTRHRAGLTGAHAEFQLRHHWVLREELFIGHHPGQGAGREEAEAVVHRETGGTIGAERQVQDVAVGPVERDTGEPGFQGIGVVADAAGIDGGSGSNEVETGRRIGLVRIVVRLGAEGLVFVFFERVACQDGISELVPLVVVRGNVVEDEAETVVLLLCQGRPTVLEGALQVLLGEFLDGLVVDGVSADGAGELEPVEGFEHRAESSLQLILINIVVFLIDDHQRIMTRQGVVAHHTPGTVRVGGGVPGLLFTGGTQNLQGTIRLLHFVKAGIGDGGVDVQFQPLGQVVRELRPAGELLEAGGEQITLFTFITGRCIETGILAAAGEGDVGALLQGNLAGNRSHPVIVLQFVRDIESLDGALLDIVIVDGHTDGVHIFGSVGHRDVLRHGGAAEVGAGVHLRAALFARLGGDKDDARICAGTVDGGGRCILQHLHTLNIVGVQLRIAFRRNTVHHVQRRGIAGDGADTADDHARALARDTGGGGNADTGHAALQSLDRVYIGAPVNLVHLHGGDGGTHQTFGSGAVTHDHQFFQSFGLYGEYHIDGSALRHVLPDSLESDGSEFQITVTGHADGILAVQVRHGGRCGDAAGNDGTADDGFTVGILHDAADGNATAFRLGLRGGRGGFVRFGHLNLSAVHGERSALTRENLAQDFFHATVVDLHGNRLIQIDLAGLDHHRIAELALEIINGCLDRYIGQMHCMLLRQGCSAQQKKCYQCSHCP